MFVFQVSRQPFLFHVELASNCAQGDVAISIGDLIWHPHKQTQQLICFHINGHKVNYHIFTKKLSTPPSLPVT